MVKKTKRYNRRPQKGGIFGFFEEKKNGINGNATSDSGIFGNFNFSNPFASAPAPNPDPNYPAPNPALAPVSSSDSYLGGRRRRKRMRGGIGTSNSLGLTYYASPVNGINVAEPTYMEYYTGGRRRKSRKTG